ncbi:hypothetical protein SK128_009197, partial [Halocaridina rubra]
QQVVLGRGSISGGGGGEGGGGGGVVLGLEENPPAAGPSSASFTEEELALVASGALPEMETIELEITKDHQGLGITIAGYVCER